MFTKNTTFAALAMVAAVATAPTLAFAADTVVATVNGSSILKADVDKVLKLNNVKSADADKAFPIIVNEMINEKLVDEAAAKAEIEKTADFQQRKEQLIKTMYVENIVKNKVTDKAVKAEYDKLKKENKGKQEVHARHILVKTEDEAKQVIKDLDAGKKFEDLAKERSSDPSAKNGGDIGFFAKDELIPAFSAAAFALKPGTYTKEPVKSEFGYHVIYAVETRERQVPELKQVEGTIRNKLTQDAVRGLVTDLRAKADIKLFDKDGKPLAEAPKKD